MFSSAAAFTKDALFYYFLILLVNHRWLAVTTLKSENLFLPFVMLISKKTLYVSQGSKAAHLLPRGGLSESSCSQSPKLWGLISFAVHVTLPKINVKIS